MQYSQMYFDEEEKEILLNYFIFQKKDCKKKYFEFLKRFQDAEPALIDLRKIDSLVMNKLWDSDKKENLINIIFQHPKFKISNNKIKDLNKLNLNWKHVNKDGSNVLHILANKGLINHCELFIKSHNISPDSMNNNGEYYTYLLLSDNVINNKINNIKNNGSLMNSLHYIDYISFVEATFKKENHHFNSINNTKINQFIDNLKKLEQHVEELFNNNKDKKIQIFKSELNVRTNNIYNFLSHFKLKNDLKNTNTIGKKIKI